MILTPEPWIHWTERSIRPVGDSVGMLSLALAGKPNAGKSTFFAAATMADVDVANYPFTTIDPNRGVSHVRTQCPCLDRDTRCGNCQHGKRYVPLELVDVAGLVPGAHQGRGLGNQFLDALTDADAVLEIVDASGGTDAEGEPVEPGSHDPRRDVDFVEEELELWLADIIERNWETIERRSRSPDFSLEPAIRDVLTGFGATEPEITACLRAVAYPDNPSEWTRDDFVQLAAELRARTLPTLVVGNKVDDADDTVLEQLLALEKPVVPATAQGELALRRGAEQQVISYDRGDETFEIIGSIPSDQQTRLERLRETMKRYGGTGVQTALNTAATELLDYIPVFPVQDAGAWTDGQGEMLPDAHLLPRGSTPLDLAYAVHSDIGDGYLHAVDARVDRQIAEDHELEAGDVIKIVSTAQ